MTAAVQPSLSSTCMGASGQITSSECGIPNSRPRPLLSKVTRRNGQMYATVETFEYTNGRVRTGRPTTRVDLGFERVRVNHFEQVALTDYPISYTDTTYRQDRPFYGTPRLIELFDLYGYRLRTTTLTYASAPTSPAPLPGVSLIGLTQRDVDTYEASGTKVASRRQTFSWNWSNLSLFESRDSTPFPVNPSEYGFITSYFYAPDDAQYWRISKPTGKSTSRYAGLGLDSTAIALSRITYDTTYPFDVTKIESALFTSANQTCASSGPWTASTCQAEIDAGLGAWVPIFQNAAYDAQGNLRRSEGIHTYTSAGAVQRHQTTTVVDASYAALPVRVTNALGHSATAAYDYAGRLTSSRDQNGQLSQRFYDTYGRLTATKAPGTAAPFTRVLSYLGNTADGYWLQERIYSDAGTFVTLDNYLDGFGISRKTVETSTLGTITQQNFAGVVSVGGYYRLVERRSLPYFSGDPIKYIETRLDERGRPLDVRRVTSTFALDKQLKTYTYGACVLGTGNCSSELDALSHGVIKYFNSREQLTATADGAGFTNYYYDVAGNVTHVQLPTNRIYNRKSATFDGWGRVRSTTEPSTGHIAYFYDNVGNLTAKKNYPTSASTTPTSQVHWTYDGLDRQLTESDGTTVKVSRTYDEATRTNGVGRLTTVTDVSGVGGAQGSTAFYYDARGNVTAEAITVPGLSLFPTTYYYRYTFNDRNQVTWKVFPDASQQFFYKSDGTLSDIYHNGVQWGAWRNWNALKQPGNSYGYWNGSYWANTTTYAYDSDQQLTRLIVRSRVSATDPNSLVQDVVYRYDAVGNVTAIADQRPLASRTIGGINTDLSQTYAYDSLDRLCKVGGTSCTSPTYTYDAIGNIVTDNGSENYYSVVGSETQIENRTGTTVNWRVHHDSEGKRTRFTDCSYSPCIDFYYSYDYRGRLTSVTKDGIVKESYTYNYDGERASKVWLGLNNAYTVTNWFIGDAYTVRRSSADTSLFAKTLSVAGLASFTRNTRGLSGPNDPNPISGQVSEATVVANQNLPYLGTTQSAVPQGTYIHNFDRVGTPTLQTRWQDGTPVARQAFDVWGNPTTTSSVGYNVNINKFSDQPYEEYSRLLYAGARYYHPGTRRFLTPDDRVVSGNSQGHNLFAYALNNPLRYTDPTGHFPFDIGSFGSLMFGPGPGASSSGLGSGFAGLGSSSLGSGLNFTPPGGVGLFSSLVPIAATRTSNTAARLGPQPLAPPLPAMENGMPLMIPGEAAFEDVRGRFGLSDGFLAGAQAADWIFNPDAFIDDQLFNGVPVTQVLTFVLSLGRTGPAAAERALMRGERAALRGERAALRLCSGGLCGGQGICFPKGTPVLTPSGQRPIEELQTGDEVLAADTETGEVVVRKVAQTLQNLSQALTTVRYGGKRVSATPTHPFWVKDHGWVAAQDLQPGMLLRTQDGLVSVEGIDTKEHFGMVYNFEVERDHNYFAGELPVLVHNADKAFSNYGAAVAETFEWLRSNGVDPETLTEVRPAKFGGVGRIISAPGGHAGYRIEWDPSSGPHINAWVHKEVSPHFTFPGNEKSVRTLIKNLFCR
jgi:RHS repeat-associated protein